MPDATDMSPSGFGKSHSWVCRFGIAGFLHYRVCPVFRNRPRGIDVAWSPQGQAGRSRSVPESCQEADERAGKACNSVRTDILATVKLVRAAGLEPALQMDRDFKSRASANSATPA